MCNNFQIVSEQATSHGDMRSELGGNTDNKNSKGSWETEVLDAVYLKEKEIYNASSYSGKKSSSTSLAKMVGDSSVVQ